MFAEKAIVRVLDETGKRVLDVKTGSKTSECRAASISPSGRLLAVHVVSRAIVYGHDDARRDTTNEVQLWDLDDGALWETVTFTPEQKVHRVGLSPGDDELIVTWDYGEGPCGLAIPSGAERWRIADDTVTAWAYSPDGNLLALSGTRLRLVDAATRRELRLPEHFGRGGCVTFSRDGKRVAASVGGTAFVHAL